MMDGWCKSSDRATESCRPRSASKDESQGYHMMQCNKAGGNIWDNLKHMPMMLYTQHTYLNDFCSAFTPYSSLSNTYDIDKEHTMQVKTG